MNPAVVAGMCAFVALNAHALGVLCLRIEPWRPSSALVPWLRAGVVVAVAANWIYLATSARV
jgi:hypothetical protein